MITAPVIDLLDKPPTRQHRTRGVGLVHELLAEFGVRDRYRFPGRAEPVPIVQPHKPVTAGIAHFVVRAGDVAVEGHRHVKY